MKPKVIPILRKIKTSSVKPVTIKKETTTSPETLNKYPVITGVGTFRAKSNVQIVHLIDDNIKVVPSDEVTDVSADIQVESSPDGILSMGKHQLITINRPRVKGFCVECIKKNQDPDYKSNMKRIRTYCPECPGGNWICEPCFIDYHTNLIAN